MSGGPNPMPLDRALPGMRLACDIRDAHGTILLAAGGELTVALLAALRRRGIGQVCVAGEATQTEDERQARREAIRIRLAHLFRRAGEAEADRRLFEAMLDYRQEQLG